MHISLKLCLSTKPYMYMVTNNVFMKQTDTAFLKSAVYSLLDCIINSCYFHPVKAGFTYT